jgi:SAM-dependent methyltransferase
LDFVKALPSVPNSSYEIGWIAMSDTLPAPGERRATRRISADLFLIGFLVLFLELACIRWFAASVVFLQFFTNVVLLASFLGMSCGCLAARRQWNWLASFPLLALATFTAARAVLLLYKMWGGVAVDVGHQASPQEVFFGTEYRNPDVAQFVVPIEFIAGLFFVLIALMFVGLGQALGRAFAAFPDRVRGYCLNIGGSLAGILGFSALSFAQSPPAVWFLVCFTGVAYLLREERILTGARFGGLAVLVAFTAMPLDWSNRHETRWSPYYLVDRETDSGAIEVNTIGHQTIIPFASGGALYSLIHLLERDSGGPPFHDALIIGAGSGNDIAHALRFGVDRVDTVEIDPVIQDIGIRFHPDRPYQDERVVRHLDDGRHFLSTTNRQYDLVVYALVDSLILHSGYANLRLESYLFTEQAFADIRRVLRPDGAFVMYNYFRQGWIVQRVAAMAQKAFGCPPVVLSLPYAETLKSSQQAGFITIIAGCNPRIASALEEQGPFWLNALPSQNLAVDGFKVMPAGAPLAPRGDWQPIAPTRLVPDNNAASVAATDDWPFLYVSGKLIPDLTIRSMVIMAILGLAMIYFFMPNGGLRLDNRMFFLGAAFMLLETKAVVETALLFGSTWIVNSAVFFTALALILAANIYVLKRPFVRLGLHYSGLFIFLAASVLVPFDAFLDGGILWRYAAPCLLALGPMFFAGVIFARSFRDEPDPDHAFGSNIAGAVIGGIAESFSTLLGFQHLLILAIGFYVLSIWSPLSRRKPA